MQIITAITEGMDVARLTGDLLIFDLENFDEEVFSNISEGIQAIIQKSPEYQALTSKLSPTPTASADASSVLSAI